ncbi:MAG TPA: histidine kinase [Amycolatopsis sp.]|uniref:sensor histidine kinase n=1 Tax=Amycolatopsis sp. TaxID=37632 RepID=UPI002B4AA640|nr:histidine kinase [Amycolatopsis sp.]HKS46309.1 histidine kinase [Amycolatopsis sp.]
MTFPRKADLAWRWLGLEGVVLLAALLCDLLIVVPAAFDNVGPNGRDLLLLPGMFAICACALWARKRPAGAAFSGAAVLVVSTKLITATHANAYSTLLQDISLSETVAGLELVFHCVRRARASAAFLAVSALVCAALLASLFRSDTTTGYRAGMTVVVGAAMLVTVVIAGLRFRKVGTPAEATAVSRLLRDQWPLTGALCVPLFFELYAMISYGVRLFPLMLCSLAAAMLAVLAARYPARSGLALAAAILGTVPAASITPRDYVLPADAMTITEVLAGLVVVVQLVRYRPPDRAWPVIAVLSLSVAVTTTVNLVQHRSRGELGSLTVAALLLLGISVATGLYFRARDSERAKVVEAAVTDAQTSERMALARELHDVVAHHVTGIVVQAQAAKMMAERNPALAMEALTRIEEAGADALTAMRRLVRSMRSHGDNAQDATTDLGADLRRLVAAGHHGVPTDVDLRLPGEIPQEVGRSALRLVQESLTNVGKHSVGATRVRVLAEVVETGSEGLPLNGLHRQTTQELHIQVSDDGRAGDPRPAGGSGGYGLVGMRERVELLRGRLIAGPVRQGWLVEAWLPLEEVAAE